MTFLWPWPISIVFSNNKPSKRESPPTSEDDNLLKEITTSPLLQALLAGVEIKKPLVKRDEKRSDQFAIPGYMCYQFVKLGMFKQMLSWTKARQENIKIMMTNMKPSDLVVSQAYFKALGGMLTHIIVQAQQYERKVINKDVSKAPVKYARQIVDQPPTKKL